MERFKNFLSFFYARRVELYRTLGIFALCNGITWSAALSGWNVHFGPINLMLAGLACLRRANRIWEDEDD